MKKLFLNILFGISLFVFSVAQAQNSNPKSQAGGLPALAREVAELRAMLEALQGQIGEPSDPYSGTYTVSLVEQTIFGCGITNDPGALLGTPAFIHYLQDQGISSTSSRVAWFDAEAAGNQLLIPSHSLSIQELRLSGTYESDVRQEDGFVVTINEDGSLTLDTGNNSVVRGQMSADGSSFVAQAFGLLDEDGCDDSYVVSLTGVRK